eukprot:TRINITY_DN2603_c1_g1_i1.p1 TRINITY_DN2603_c1_g1~~TRINITY_DN2603_c1_g1_i1.p1  ORF type:complete len:364 (-),score=31.18 TRINITY_DN2603_c1_g1_i1:79-1170(-)
MEEDSCVRSPLDLAEILSLVFENVHAVSDLGSLMLVCKQWYSLVSRSTLLWKARCMAACPGAVELIEFKKRLNAEPQGYNHWKKSFESYSQQGWFLTKMCNFGHLTSNLKLGLYFSQFMIEHGLRRPDLSTRKWIRSNLYIWLHSTVVAAIHGDNAKSEADKIRISTLNEVALEAIKDHQLSIKQRFLQMIQNNTRDLGTQLFILWKEHKIFTELIGFIFHDAIYSKNSKVIESYQFFSDQFQPTLSSLLPDIQSATHELEVSELYKLQAVLDNNLISLFQNGENRGLGEVMKKVDQYEPNDEDTQMVYELGSDEGLGSVVVGRVKKLMVRSLTGEKVDFEPSVNDSTYSSGFFNRYRHLWRH